MPCASIARRCGVVLLGLHRDLRVPLGLERGDHALREIDLLDHERDLRTIAAGLVRRPAEVVVAERGLQALAQAGLDVGLQGLQQLVVAVDVGGVVATGFLLDRALELLAERVPDEVGPARTRRRVVAKTELLVELTQLVDVQLEVRGDLVVDLHAVLRRSDDRVRARDAALALGLGDDVRLLVGGVEVERVEHAVEEERVAGLRRCAGSANPRSDHRRS